MNLLKRPSYRRGPVRSLAKLASALDVAEPQLQKLIENANAMYWYRPQLKKDGSKRDTWDAQPQLKHLQELLNRRFLNQVEFPLYLQGGIRDHVNPRDYVRHVAVHAGAACALALDIADFYPSITETKIYDVWRHFFRFSDVVASALTKLTTKDGQLPQGAKTSSYLANLVFWRNEHVLVSKLDSQGWKYSRLIDDVTVSKQMRPGPHEETSICASVIGFVQSYGFTIKRTKLKMHRQNRQMTLNSLGANVRPTLPKAERNNIRGQVKGLAKQLTQQNPVEVTYVRSTLGKIAKLRRFHEGDATALRATLPKDIECLAVVQDMRDTLGNLTLTGYNSEYRDFPFAYKRDEVVDKDGNPIGFAHSPLKLNLGLGKVATWNEDAIKARADRLALEAAKVWSAPQLPPDVFDAYRPAALKAGQQYSIDDHPFLASGPMRELFDLFREAVLALDPCVSEEFLKLYVAYKAETNFVDVVPQAKRLRLAINMPFHEIDDPKGICLDVTNLGRWGNGDIEVGIAAKEDLPYIMGLVRQSFDRQMGGPQDA